MSLSSQRPIAGRSAAQVFDVDADRYDAAYDSPGLGGHVLRSRLAAVVRLLGDGEGSVLDVGMGPGRLCAALAERGWIASGIDPSPRMVERARKRLPERSGGFVTGRAEALPFPDAAFDAVVATGSLEFVADLERAVAELRRVTRRGGRAVISFPHYRLPYSIFTRLLLYPAVRVVKSIVQLPRPAPPAHRHPYGRSRFESLLGDSGFEIESAEYVGVYMPPARLARRLEGGGELTGRLLATQMVFLARRP